MSTPIHGYLIVDKKTGEPDWDGEVHPTAHAAIESLCKHASFCRVEEATDEGPEPWTEVYDIHPVGPALDPDYAAALADPEGHALVQAIHDRKETVTPPAAPGGHDTPTMYRIGPMRVTHVKCSTCFATVAALDDGMLTIRSGRAREHFEELVETAMKLHREELEANRDSADVG